MLRHVKSSPGDKDSTSLLVGREATLYDEGMRMRVAKEYRSIYDLVSCEKIDRVPGGSVNRLRRISTGNNGLVERESDVFQVFVRGY